MKSASWPLPQPAINTRGSGASPLGRSDGSAEMLSPAWAWPVAGFGGINGDATGQPSAFKERLAGSAPSRKIRAQTSSVSRLQSSLPKS